MKFFICFFIICFPVFLFGQVNISGIVMDAKHRLIPFASIGYYNKQIGTSTDSLGTFIIQKRVADSLKISAVGYESITVIISDTSTIITAYLNNVLNLLSEVVIKSRPKKSYQVTLGHYQAKNNFWNLLAPNLQEATYIPNPDKIKGYIDEIKFKVAEFKNKHFMLRIRLFDVDVETGKPNGDLLMSENIIYPNDLKRTTIFVTKSKNIRFPENGVFVSFEWLQQRQDDKRETFPYILGNTDAYKDFVYLNFKEIKWRRANIKSVVNNGYYVPNLSITVSY